MHVIRLYVTAGQDHMDDAEKASSAARVAAIGTTNAATSHFYQQSRFSGVIIAVGTRI